jgi:hypothetical protein
VVIIGTVLIVLLLCVAIVSVIGGGAFIAHAVVTAPTATPRGGSTGPVLQQMPEDSLRYPAADSLESGAGERLAGLGKGRYAVAWRRFGTPDSADRVERWYDQQLTARGWVASGGRGPGTPTITGRDLTWAKGDFTFRLIIYDPARSAQERPDFVTVYYAQNEAQP